MSRDALYVAAYDLGDTERERTAQLLEGYGFRVQRSVFELRLSRGQREQMLAALEKLELKTGSVLLYRRDATGRRYEKGVPNPRRLEEDCHAWILGVPPKPDPAQTPISETPSDLSKISPQRKEVS